MLSCICRTSVTSAVKKKTNMAVQAISSQWPNPIAVIPLYAHCHCWNYTWFFTIHDKMQPPQLALSTLCQDSKLTFPLEAQVLPTFSVGWTSTMRLHPFLVSRISFFAGYRQFWTWKTVSFSVERLLSSNRWKEMGRRSILSLLIFFFLK